MNKNNLLRKSAIFVASSLLGFSQFSGCYNLLEERCAPNGYFEGIINGGGGVFELYNAVLTDQICGAVVGGLESLASNNK